MDAAKHDRGPNAKGHKGVGMNGWMARWYARTRANDMADFRAQAEAVARRLPEGARVLEVAPGPGYFAIALARLGSFRITGLDISPTMVEIATDSAAEAKVTVEFEEGNAAAMPFGDGTFDFIYCSAAFKNFAEPVTALNEMHRVLRAGGEAMIVDLRKDASLDDVRAYVKESGRSGFDAWVTRVTFKHLLIKRAYSRADFNAMAGASRFGHCRLSEGPIGFDVRLTKAAALA